jgi:hypothetical protein
VDGDPPLLFRRRLSTRRSEGLQPFDFIGLCLEGFRFLRRNRSLSLGGLKPNPYSFFSNLQITQLVLVEKRNQSPKVIRI